MNHAAGLEHPARFLEEVSLVFKMLKQAGGKYEIRGLVLEGQVIHACDDIRARQWLHVYRCDIGSDTTSTSAEIKYDGTGIGSCRELLAPWGALVRQRGEESWETATEGHGI